MRVKKQIALLLSGAVLAGSLAGCAQTAVDHHFFTETLTDVEYVTSISGLAELAGFSPENLQSFQSIETYAKENDIKWTFYLYPSFYDLQNLIIEPLEASVENWKSQLDKLDEVEGSSFSMFCYKLGEDVDLAKHMSFAAECVEMLPQALEDYTETITEKFDYMNIHIYRCEVDGKDGTLVQVFFE